MENTGFQEVVVLMLIFVTTGPLMAIKLLASQKKVLERLFPDHRPKDDLFGPPNQAQSDALVITIYSRIFALSFFGLVLV